jgi:hypothetical protein
MEAQVSELVKALAAAQADFPPIEKHQENKHFGSKYADLAACLNAVRPTLAKHGIALVQVVEENEHGTTLVTKLLHEAGELVSTMPLPMDGLNSQQIGSMMTYARRYSALAICGVHPVDDDDDGNAASTAEAPQRRSSGRPSGSQSKPGTPTEKQVNYANRLLNEVVHHSLHHKTLREQTGKSSTLDLNTAEMSGFIDWLLEQKKAGRTAEGDIAADAADGTEPFDVPVQETLDA